VTTPLRWLVVVAVVVAVAATTALVAAQRRPGVTTVHVRIHHSLFEPAAFSFATGETVRFVVQNADPIDHEFILGDRAVQLAHERGTEAYHPPRPGEMTIRAGETATTTYTFEAPGPSILGCHLPGHYAFGMRAPVVVG
jgi:uncharacterized cupredoxin-like copper-binding protein